MKNLTVLCMVFWICVFFFQCSTSEIEPFVPEPEVKTYEKDVKLVIQNSCATTNCHDAVDPSAGLPLTTYDEVRNATENGSLISRINDGNNPMPPTGRDLSIVALIDNWKTNGYLEN